MSICKICYFRFVNVNIISNIVADLLKSNECVTIPEFGAFVVNPSNAQIDMAKNRFTPPGKQVSFNKNISNNDGLVANALSQKEGISYKDSVTYLKGFVQTVQDELKQKTSFDFGEVGSFYLTAENLLKFEPNTFQSPFEIGLEAFHLTPLSDAIGIGKEEIKPESVSPQIKYVSTLSSWGKVGWAVAALPLIAYLAWVPAQSGVLDKQKSFQFSDLNPFRTAPCEEYVARPAGLTGLSLEGEELLFDDFDETTYKFAVAETTNVVNEYVVPDLSMTELPYQIIGGCFGQKSNATRMVNKLNRKGFPAQIFDYKNGLYRVTYGGYATMTEARMALREVKSIDNSSAWLFKANR